MPDASTPTGSPREPFDERGEPSARRGRTGWVFVVHRVLGGLLAGGGAVMLFMAPRGPASNGTLAGSWFALGLLMVVGGLAWFTCGWMLGGR